MLPDSERFYIKALRKHRILHVFFEQKTTVSMLISTYSEAQWLVCQSYDPAAVDQDKAPPTTAYTLLPQATLAHL